MPQEFIIFLVAVYAFIALVVGVVVTVVEHEGGFRAGVGWLLYAAYYTIYAIFALLRWAVRMTFNLIRKLL